MKTNKIVFSSVFILIVTIFLLFELHNSTKIEVLDKFKAQQLFTAKLLSKEIESCLHYQSLAIEVLSSFAEIKNKDKRTIALTVEEYYKYMKKDHVKSISLYNENGAIIYSTSEDAAALLKSDSDYFTRAAKRENKGKQFIISELPFKSAQPNKSSIFQVMIATPVYSEISSATDDKFAGIIYCIIDLDEILKSFFMIDSLHGVNEHAWILDKNGTVMYQSEHPEMIKFDVHQQDESCFECHNSFKYVETILSKTSGTTEYRLKNNPPKLASFSSLEINNISWRVVVNIPLDEVTSFVDKNLIQTLVLFVIIILTLLGSSFIIFRSNRAKVKSEMETEKLRAKQIFNLILESAGEGIFGLDLQGNHTFVNPMAASLFGYRVDELNGKHSHTIWHHTRPNGDPYPATECPIYATLKDGISHFGEEYFWRKDSSGCPVDFSATPILEGGKVTGAVVAFRDITERKKAEEALRASEERFRSVTQSSNDAIIIANKVGTILGWNRDAEKIFGFADTEIIGKSIEFIIPLDNLKQPNAGMELLVTESELHIVGNIMELQGLHKSGNVFPLELSLSEWETSEGKYFTIIIRDISERKKVEAELEKQREVLEKLNGLSGLLAVEMPLEHSLEKGLHIILSTSFLRLEKIGGLFLSEIGKNELVLKCNINLPEPLQTMCAHVPFGHCLCGRAASTAEIQYSDCVDERHDNLYQGIKPHGHYNVPILSDGAVLGVIVVYLSVGHLSNPLEMNFLRSAADVFSAIITRKRAEEEIKSKNEQLKKTNSEKDKFFSIIAHDLRGPISGFFGITEMMVKDAEDFSKAELAEFNNSMHESASTLYKLLENLLEWAQMQKGSISFTPRELSLANLVSNSIATINDKALQKGIIIINEVSATERVYADEKMIESILRNFLSNAVKFTRRDGKVVVRAKKTVNEMVEVSVSDTGVGIAEKYFKKLFRMDEKINTPGTEGEPSTGLGLLLCKEFVEKNGGNVWAESEKGKGSIFYFTVPESSHKNN
jgi:PAS domain S-box-containing protein